MRRNSLWIVLAVVAAVGFAVGTVGVDTAAMDRGVSATVSDHDRALVTLWDPGVGTQGQAPEAVRSAGLAGEDPVTEDGARTRVLVVQNRFPDRWITVDATVVDAPPDLGVGPFDPVTLAPGAVAPLLAPVQCGTNTGPTTITLRVRASNDQFEGVITVDATVVCAVPPAQTTTANETATEPQSPRTATNGTATG
jgi:hypothetical protein